MAIMTVRSLANVSIQQGKKFITLPARSSAKIKRRKKGG